MWTADKIKNIQPVQRIWISTCLHYKTSHVFSKETHCKTKAGCSADTDWKWKILQTTTRIICPICSERRIRQGLEPEIESEIHFLIFCDEYSILREKLFSTLNKPATFEMLDESTKLSILLNQPENCKPTAQFIADAFSMRSKLINKV